MWVGVAIVAVSVVAGVRLVGSADDSVAIWAVTEDLGAGTSVEAEHVEARSVRFADVDDLARYLPADQPLPPDRSLVRGIGAGELLPAAALGSTGQSGVLQVPIRVPVDGVPASVDVGSRVDVYVSDDTRGGPSGRPPARRRHRDGRAELGRLPRLRRPPAAGAGRPPG